MELSRIAEALNFSLLKPPQSFLFIGINIKTDVFCHTQIILINIQREKLSEFETTSGIRKKGTFVIGMKILMRLIGNFLTNTQICEIKKLGYER